MFENESILKNLTLLVTKEDQGYYIAMVCGNSLNEPLSRRGVAQRSLRKISPSGNTIAPLHI